MGKLQPNDTILINYRVEKSIGQGAFGEVYLVTHTGLNGKRAVKVLLREDIGVGSSDYDEFRNRFRQESQLMEWFNHPNIIRVYDFQEVEKTLYLIMEYAEQGSLRQRMDRLKKEGRHFSVEEAVKIGIDIASGLSALHQKDVIHRDLKPSNILFDADGRAKVADLGLAQVPGGASMRSQLSIPKPHPGTPAYMSPEQETAGSYLRPSSDIYSLGLILFEMLTGRGYKSLRPGTRLKSLAEDVPEWMDDVLARMLSENPRDRQWDGAEVADDLRKGSGSIPLKPDEKPASDLPWDGNIGEELLPSTSEIHPSVLTPVDDSVVPGEQILPEKGSLFRWKPSRKHIGLAGILLLVVIGIFSIGNLDLFNNDPPGLISPGRVNQIKETASLQASNDQVMRIAFTKDGKSLLSVTNGKFIQIWDVAGKTEKTKIWWEKANFLSAAFSPDGKTLVTGSGDEVIHFRNGGDGKVNRVSQGNKGNAWVLVFSPDGKNIASGNTDNTVKIWDPANGSLKLTLNGHTSFVTDLAYSPDGFSLAASSLDNTIRIWNPLSAAGIQQIKGHDNAVMSVAFSPDGKTLASASSDQSVRLWDPTTGKQMRVLNGHSGEVWSVAFSPDGRLLASGSMDDTVILWNAETGQKLRTLTGHTSDVASVAFSPDGKILASGSTDKSIKFWTIP